MIDYKELRIENWIRQSKRSGGVTANEFDCQVHEINAKGLNVGYGGVYLEWEFCEGIPLSKEILGSYGMESVVGKIDENYKFKLIDFCRIIKKSDDTIELFYNPFDNTLIKIAPSVTFFCPKIKYVHQLQNLYYSLTNEELIYKP
jgi:hypothetical protein